jgi:hypothetical protein
VKSTDDVNKHSRTVELKQTSICVFPVSEWTNLSNEAETAVTNTSKSYSRYGKVI